MFWGLISVRNCVLLVDFWFRSAGLNGLKRETDTCNGEIEKLSSHGLPLRIDTSGRELCKLNGDIPGSDQGILLTHNYIKWKPI